MKEKYKAFKEWKKNPRHKALYQLLCWIMYFVILYLVAISGIFGPHYKSSSSPSEENFTSDVVENYRIMNSYEYEYNITYDEQIIIIKGLAFEDKYYYTIGDNAYYDDGILYLVDEENKQLIVNPEIELPIPLLEIEQGSIYNWLKEAIVDESIEYSNNDKKVTYKYAPTNEYEIIINTSEKDYLINELEMDLTNFLLSKDIQVNTFKFNVKYTNINNIKSYEKNYTDYQVIGLEEDTDEETVEDTNPDEAQDKPLEEGV